MTHPPAIELARGVWRVPTVRGPWLNCFVLGHDDGSVTLVDTGMSWGPKRVLAALDHLGRRPADVRRIVLTHAHIDHAGGAAELVRRTGAAVAVHRDDVPYAGQGIPPRSDTATRGGRLMARLPRARFPAVPVSETLLDGQVVDGLRVVATPGHTPGHISLLHEPTGVLVVGDALMNWGRPRISPGALCSDAALCRDTVVRLAELEPEVVAFCHGPETEPAVVREYLKRADGAA